MADVGMHAASSSGRDIPELPPFSALDASTGSPTRQGTSGMVHIVDGDSGVCALLTRWLTAAGFKAQRYAALAEFLQSRCEDMPSCLVMDAELMALRLLSPAFTPQAISTKYPVVITACGANIGMAVRAMKIGAVDFVPKPLCQTEIICAVSAAVEVDRCQRLVAARQIELHVRYATLSRRERQVMALVTAGKLNKQVGFELCLSEITVKAHRGAVMRKMQAHSFAELVRMADTLGCNAIKNSC